MRHIKIIMHTHWDREWYFTKDETQVLLKNHMYEVVNFLRKNPDSIYILDGQSVMVDDLLEIEPNLEDEIRNLVENKQLLLGPWYTQTDLLIVHGESIIRNLYYGIKRALEFSNVMLSGYAPDTFGHNEQMPQIYKQFGIDNTIFWRGFSELKSSKSDFVWEGIDGSQIIGVNLATGYQGAKYLESDYFELKERMDKILVVLDKYSATESRLIMNGHDQMPIQTDIYEIISDLEKIYPDDKIEITNFESYIEDLRKVSDSLDVVTGELIHSKHARIHKTINSTRMDIKLLNAEIEYNLIKVLEPLCVIATRYEIPYPHALFEKCYKILFGVHAHDSIGGCNSDKVNQDIKQRLLVVNEMVDTEIEQVKRRITTTYGTYEDALVTIFNPLMYDVENNLIEVEIQTKYKDFNLYINDDVLEYEIVEQQEIDAGVIDRQVAARLLDIKTFITKVLVKVPLQQKLSVQLIKVIEEEKFISKVLDNNFVTVEVVDNQINMVDKVKNINYDNFLVIENSCDAGDSYDYSPPIEDLVVTDRKIKVVSLKETSFGSVINLSYKMLVPKNQEVRSKKILDTEVEFLIALVVSKLDGSIDVKMSTMNKIEDSRFRVVFNTMSQNDYVNVDMQLCTTKRNIYQTEALAVWEKENWAEKPVCIETMQSFVNHGDMSIFTRGLKEYEVVDSKVFITLFRSFSHLGKRNLVNRPGRPSGIEIPTPDNQLSDICFNLEFKVVLNASKNSLAKISHEYLSKISGYHLKEFNRFNINKNKINNILSFNLEDVEFKGLVVSCLKLTEENDDLFIRLFNPTDHDIEIEFSHYSSNMLEEKLEKCESLNVGSNQIINIIREL